MQTTFTPRISKESDQQRYRITERKLKTIKGIYAFSVDKSALLSEVESELKKIQIRCNGTYRDGSSIKAGGLFESIDTTHQVKTYLWVVNFIEDMNGTVDGAQRRFQSILEAEQNYLANLGTLELAGLVESPDSDQAA